MKNKGGLILFILLGSFAIIQLWQVEKNNGRRDVPGDLLKQHQSIPDTIASTIVSACYDCHSDQTIYPWYAYAAPFSWIIGQHISNGKEAMNFSYFGALDRKQKIAVLNAICEVITDSTMPPSNYVMLHKEAVLDTEMIAAICDWADEAAMDIIRNR